MDEQAAPQTAAPILGVQFDLVDHRAVLYSIDAWRRRGERSYVTFTNPHSAMLCRSDEEMARAVAGAGLTLPDGMGIIMAAKLLGYENVGRVTGPSFMLELCDRGRRYGYRHCFCGGKGNRQPARACDPIYFRRCES